MSYIEHEWENRQVISATKLNEMEMGIKYAYPEPVIFSITNEVAKCNFTWEELCNIVVDQGRPISVQYAVSTITDRGTRRTYMHVEPELTYLFMQGVPGLPPLVQLEAKIPRYNEQAEVTSIIHIVMSSEELSITIEGDK